MATPSLYSLSDISALVLAGGRGMRMGGLDKGLQTLNGKPMGSQPVFCLMRKTVAPGLQAFLASGGHKVQAWMAALQVVHAPFNAPGDAPRAFANANSPDELRALESLVFQCAV